MDRVRIKQFLFRFVGLSAIGGGLYTLYDRGPQLVPLFEFYIKGGSDWYLLFSVLTSFFLGAPALVWMGTRLLTLRAFKPFWIHLATFLIAVVLLEQYSIYEMFKMDHALTTGVLYIVVYFIVHDILLYVRRRWYLPLSHESARYIRLEEPRPTKGVLKPAALMAILLLLLILHPENLATTLKMLVSPFQSVFTFFD